MADGDRPGRTLWLLLPEPVRALPADLAAVVALVVCTVAAVLVPGVNETPLRLILGLPFVLLLPGYTLVAALFPERGPERRVDGDESGDDEAESADGGDDGSGLLGSASDTDESGIDGVERVALSLGLSLAVVPLVGLVVNFTPWGIRLNPILLSIALFTLGMTAAAAARRRALPPEERFRVPYRAWLATAREEIFEPNSGVDAALNVLLAVSVLLAMGAVGYAVLVPPQGESFSEFYLLSENEDGDLVAAEYPTEFTLGESRPVVVGIGNHENEPVEYTVVVQLQEVEIVDNETRVQQREELDRFSSPTIEDNRTWRRTHEIQPTMAGERLRVQYLLYRGEVPAEPTAGNAYRELHLWIDVEG